MVSLLPGRIRYPDILFNLHNSTMHSGSILPICKGAPSHQITAEYQQNSDAHYIYTMIQNDGANTERLGHRLGWYLAAAMRHIRQRGMI